MPAYPCPHILKINGKEFRFENSAEFKKFLSEGGLDEIRSHVEVPKEFITAEPEAELKTEGKNKSETNGKVQEESQAQNDVGQRQKRNVLTPSEAKPVSPTSEKSILNQETDLKGDKKEEWMQDASKIETPKAKHPLEKLADKIIEMGLSVNNRDQVNAAIGELSKDDFRALKSYISTLEGVDIHQRGNEAIKELKQLVVGRGEKNTIISEIKKAIGDKKYKIESKFAKAISEGRMTAQDAKTIIENAGLEVPKDILDLVKPKELKTNRYKTTEKTSPSVPIEKEEVAPHQKIKTIAEANDFARAKGFPAGARHLLNSFKKATGKEYKNIQDIPTNELNGFLEGKKTVKEEKIRPVSKGGKIIINDKGNMTDELPSQFEQLKNKGDLSGLDDLYSTVRIFLNGIAQSKGEKTVKQFEAFKKEIEDYAEVLKKEKSQKVESPKEEVTPAGKEIEPHKNVKDTFKAAAKDFKLSDGEIEMYEKLKDVPPEEREQAAEDFVQETIDNVENIKQEIESINNKILDEDGNTGILKASLKIEKAKLKKAEKLVDDLGGHIHKNGDFANIDIGGINKTIGAINARVETRKAVKAGTDLFPEDAGISEKELRKQKANAKIAEGIDNIAKKVTNRKNLLPEEKTALIDDLKKIVSGLIERGEITAEEAIQAIKEHLNKFYSHLLDKKEIEDISENIIEDKKVGIAHAETEKVRQEFGLGEYQKTKKTKAELEEEADKLMKEGYNIETLISKMENGELPTDVEQVLMRNYLSGLAEKIDKNPLDDTLLAQARRAVEASDKLGGSEVARSLAARRGIKNRDETLLDYFMQEQDINQNAPLTEGQKRNVIKEFNEITEAKDALEKKLKDLEEENTRLKAEKELKNFERETRKRKRSLTTEKLDQDFDELSKEFKKIASGQLSAGINPELVAIVGRMAKNRIEKGIVKLVDVVDEIHSKLSDHLDKKEIREILAGEHSEPKKTRSEIAKKLYELKQEAILVDKYEKLTQGIEPKTEKEKIVRNQRLESLRKSIKEHDLSKLADYKNRIKSQTEKLEEDLRTNNILKEKPIPPKLDKEAIELKDKYIKLKREREIRIMKAKYENRNKYEKFRDKTLDILNVPRTIMSSMDFSAPLRQALVATVAHPKTASMAGLEMFKQAFSQKRFDRWFHDIKQDPLYARSQESGLYIADPHDPRLTAKEEAFMNNLAEKIPVAGKFIKGSERAYVGYLNKMRWDLFHKFAEQFEADGRTFDNSPELYKGLASFVNNSTGRGKIWNEGAAPMLNTAFFAPRLIASRLNFLNPLYYAKLPKEIRIQALKDVIKVIGIGGTVLALAKLNGADVEGDPRSSDFGKIKSGNTRWDIWGGYQQYIRVIAQLASGKYKSATTGKINDLSGEGVFGRTRGDVLLSFTRGKLAPLPSIGADVLAGRTISGEKTTLKGEAENHLLPLLYSDIKDALKDKGTKAIFTAGVPAMFGVGVQTYMPKNKKPTSSAPSLPVLNEK